MIANKIAVVWDFDKTLVNGYMQSPIFKHYNIDDKAFWKEVNTLPEYYEQEYGIKVNKDTIYLNHFLTCTKQGIFKGLNNEMLRNFGKELVFYNGVPDIFRNTKDFIENESRYKEFDIKVEHYIVSTGLTEVIKGSVVMEYVEDVWGCEFIENERQSNLGEHSLVKESRKEISQIGFAIDNTSKTRALFEINKGSNKHREIDVNGKIPHDSRRIPFSNMIYIADGPSDVPAFSVVKKNGGKTFAIYPKGDEKAFNQVNSLIKQGRIDMYSEADYSENTTTYMWITNAIKEIAERIYQEQKELISKNITDVPIHIV
jgi:hypothetical protein